MCGICGFMDHTNNASISNSIEMLSLMHHRGPDQIGVYLDGETWHGESINELKELKVKGSLSLGQTRLEIVGGEKGVQPMSGTMVTIVHNGEIYNYKELASLVSNKNTTINSDSEIIVRLIEEFYEGSLIEAVKRAMPLLDGMYAFAATDGKSLVLARDPIGKKPLYFTNEFPFYFASERKALINGNGNIKRLTPGWIAEVSREGIKFEKVCEIERPPIEINSMNDALAAYEDAFDRSIEKRIYGLDKVGVLFSGGIDSVLVSRALQLKGCDVTCYTVGTENCSDLRMALKAAEELGLSLKAEYLTEELIERILGEVIEAIELNGLLQVEVAIPMYIAAKMCREDDHKVMFTGQAADELFAGYPWYNDVVREDGHLVLHDKLWEDIDKLYLDTLEREDRMAMAHSIELRAPFLDRELIRTAMRISPRLKISDEKDPYRKRVHRELALKKGITREISYREKSPAQDGTGIHDLIKVIAEKHFDGKNFEEVNLLDYGSNYRYLGDDYGTPAMLAFLEEITVRNDVNSIAGSDENI